MAAKGKKNLVKPAEIRRRHKSSHDAGIQMMLHFVKRQIFLSYEESIESAKVTSNVIVGQKNGTRQEQGQSTRQEQGQWLLPYQTTKNVFILFRGFKLSSFLPFTISPPRWGGAAPRGVLRSSLVGTSSEPRKWMALKRVTARKPGFGSGPKRCQFFITSLCKHLEPTLSFR